jgi:ubiquinone/menaquinone biosynthesis C-methylase UbiE
MIYNQYAAVYDQSGQFRFSWLMASYLQNVLQRHPVAGKYMLDLACGTGTLALLMAERGWHVTGLDASPAMLAQAQQKKAEAEPGQHINFVQGDMRHLAGVVPPDSFHLVTCIYDSLNYLHSEADLAVCFGAVSSVLAPGGLFIGDMNTSHFLEHDWGTQEVLTYPGYVQIGHSYFDPLRSTTTMYLTGFVGDDEQGYVRFDEVHTERAYPQATIANLLQQTGLYVEAVYDCFTFNPPYDTSQRLAWVVRKSGPEQQSVRL